MAEQKVKVADIALELGMQTKEILAKAAEIDITIKSVQSSVSPADAEVIYNYIATGKVPEKPKTTTKTTAKKATKKTAESDKSAKSKESAKDSDKDSKKTTAKKTATKKTTESDKVAKSKESAKATKTTKTKKSKEIDETPKDSSKDSQKSAESPEIKQESATQEAKKEVKKIETRKIIIISKNTQSTQKEKSTKEQLSKARDLRDKILHPSADFGDEEAPKYKSKKDRKKEAAKKIHTNEQKIDLNRNLGDTNIDDDDEVMLLDMSDEKSDERQEKPEERITDRIHIQRANPWFFDSVSRERKKKGRGLFG